MAYHEFDTEELRALIQGKFRFYPCLECSGKGRVLVDGIAGLVVESIHPEADPTDYYWDACEDCNSIGGTISWL